MQQSFYYTLGRVISKPKTRTGKGGKHYQTVFVELLGGMRASALTTAHLDLSIGEYAGVKITPNGHGQSTYNVLMLDKDSQTMICDAAEYLSEDCETAGNDNCANENADNHDSDDELPF